MEEIRMGVYRHYKGHHYRVKFLASDANAEDLYTKWTEETWELLGERDVVVYESLDPEGRTGHVHKVRTVSDFLAWVQPAVPGMSVRPPHEDDRAAAINEGWTPRFTYIGEDV